MLSWFRNLFGKRHQKDVIHLKVEITSVPKIHVQFDGWRPEEAQHRPGGDSAREGCQRDPDNTSDDILIDDLRGRISGAGTSKVTFGKDEENAEIGEEERNG